MIKKPGLTQLGLTLLLAALGACDAPAPSTPAPGPQDSAEPGDAAATAPLAASAGIDWFEGGVDAAFALAKRERKPLFLYWGAAWCPPCHYIHEVIFSNPEFIARSRLFVPVALDGDSASAQQLGERLGVVGYPTMIVYDADGEEITRIPGGIDMAAYANVLDVALSAARPVSAIVAGALDGGASLDRADCELAAYYSWSQDNERVLAARSAPEVFGRLAAACPADASKPRMRLGLERLARLVEAGEAASTALAADAQAPAVAQLEELFGNYALAKDNAYYTFFSGADFIAAATPAGGKERAELEAAYLQVLDRMEHDVSLYPSWRLYAVIGKLKLSKLGAGEDASVPEPLQRETEALVAWADESTRDPNQRQVVMNAAWGALLEAGLDADANAMLMREISKASQPHYFMSGLAELARKAGHDTEALRWLEQAYETANGQATRFQWGTDYVVGLLEMAPDDSARIETAAEKLFGELASDPETAFFHRNVLRMQRLEQALEQWNADGAHAETIEQIRGSVQALCAEIDAGQPSRGHCEAFLASA